MRPPRPNRILAPAAHGVPVQLLVMNWLTVFPPISLERGSSITLSSRSLADRRTIRYLLTGSDNVRPCAWLSDSRHQVTAILYTFLARTPRIISQYIYDRLLKLGLLFCSDTQGPQHTLSKRSVLENR